MDLESILKSIVKETTKLVRNPVSYGLLSTLFFACTNPMDASSENQIIEDISGKTDTLTIVDSLPVIEANYKIDSLKTDVLDLGDEVTLLKEKEKLSLKEINRLDSIVKHLVPELTNEIDSLKLYISNISNDTSTVVDTIYEKIIQTIYDTSYVIVPINDTTYTFIDTMPPTFFVDFPNLLSYSKHPVSFKIYKSEYEKIDSASLNIKYFKDNEVVFDSLVLPDIVDGENTIPINIEIDSKDYDSLYIKLFAKDSFGKYNDKVMGSKIKIDPTKIDVMFSSIYDSITTDVGFTGSGKIYDALFRFLHPKKGNQYVYVLKNDFDKTGLDGIMHDQYMFIPSKFKDMTVTELRKYVSDNVRLSPSIGGLEFKTDTIYQGKANSISFQPENFDYYTLEIFDAGYVKIKSTNYFFSHVYLLDEEDTSEFVNFGITFYKNHGDGLVDSLFVDTLVPTNIPRIYDLSLNEMSDSIDFYLSMDYGNDIVKIKDLSYIDEFGGLSKIAGSILYDINDDLKLFLIQRDLSSNEKEFINSKDYLLFNLSKPYSLRFGNEFFEEYKSKIIKKEDWEL